MEGVVMQYYQCPECLMSLSTGIKLTALPSHKCPAKKDRLINMPQVETVVPIPEGWRWVPSPAE